MLAPQWSRRQLETFTTPKEFVKNPRYLQDRQNSLEALDVRAIDRPIVELVERYTLLPQCFTHQSCYGHFLYASGQDTHNLERLPSRSIGTTTYRIAYMAFCLEDSPRGRSLHESLELVPRLDPDYVQFGSADWFLERYRNSYVLQVEPMRFKTEDQALIEHSEAIHVEKIRDLFFIRMWELLERHLYEARRG